MKGASTQDSSPRSPLQRTHIPKESPRTNSHAFVFKGRGERSSRLAISSLLSVIMTPGKCTDEEEKFSKDKKYKDELVYYHL